MNLTFKRQQGMSMLTLICVIGFAVSVFLLGLKIAPIYVDHSKVSSVLKSLKDNPEAHSESPDQLLARIDKFFQINNVTGINPKEDISIEVLDNGMTKVEIEYEVTKPLVGNLSALVNFKDKVELPKK